MVAATEFVYLRGPSFFFFFLGGGSPKVTLVCRQKLLGNSISTSIKVVQIAVGFVLRLFFLLIYHDNHVQRSSSNSHAQCGPRECLGLISLTLTRLPIYCCNFLTQVAIPTGRCTRAWDRHNLSISYR